MKMSHNDKQTTQTHKFLTQVVGAGLSLSDVDSRGSGWDIQDFVVTQWNARVHKTS